MEQSGDRDNPYRYAGYQFDGETDLYYLKSRYYDSETGRFLSQDSHWNTENMIYGDNHSKNPSYPAISQSLALYVYTTNNPLQYTDPTGEYRLDKSDPHGRVFAFVDQNNYECMYDKEIGYIEYYSIDTLWSIAKKEVNDGNRWRKIYGAEDPENLHVGQCLDVTDLYEVIVNGVYYPNPNPNYIKPKDVVLPNMQFQSQWTNSDETIKQKGCALTCASMVLNYYGAETTVNSLYALQGNQIEADFNNIINLIGMSKKLKVDEYKDKKPEEVFCIANSEIRSYHPVIIGMKRKSGGTHYVVAYGVTGVGDKSSDFLILDPGLSNFQYYTLEQSLSHFGATPFRVIVYSKKS